MRLSCEIAYVLSCLIYGCEARRLQPRHSAYAAELGGTGAVLQRTAGVRVHSSSSPSLYEIWGRLFVCSCPGSAFQTSAITPHAFVRANSPFQHQMRASANSGAATERTNSAQSQKLSFRLDRRHSHRRHGLQLGLAAVAAMVFAPSAAKAASFGAARASITSKTLSDRNMLTPEELEALDPRKRAMVESLLSPDQLEQFLAEYKQKRLEVEGLLKLQNEEIEIEKERRNNVRAKANKLRASREEVRSLEEAIARDKQAIQSNLQGGMLLEPFKGQSGLQSIDTRMTNIKYEKKFLRQLERDLKIARRRVETDNDELTKYVQLDQEAQKAITKTRRLTKDVKRAKQAEQSITERTAKLKALANLPEWFTYTTGFIASIISTLVLYPIDTVKTRIVSGEDWRGIKVESSAAQPVEQKVKIGKGLRLKKNQADSKLLPATNDDISGMVPRPKLEQKVLSNGATLQPRGKIIALAQSIPAAKEIGPELEGLVASTALDGLKASRRGENRSDVQLEDITGLYQGVWQSALLKQGLPAALNTGIFEMSKKGLSASPFLSDQRVLAYAIAQVIAKTADSIIGTPAEAIKTRVQCGVDSTELEAAQNTLLKAQGRDISRKGWIASLIRDWPYVAVQIIGFEALVNYIATSPNPIIDVDVNSFGGEVLLNTLVGLLGAFITVPADVVTTRILLQKDGSSSEPKGFLEMFDQIRREGGWKALLAGANERVWFEAPTIGLFTGLYCFLNQQAVSLKLFDV